MIIFCLTLYVTFLKSASLCLSLSLAQPFTQNVYSIWSRKKSYVAKITSTAPAQRGLDGDTNDEMSVRDDHINCKL